nr:MAG TPA: hypothetical protein [Inoviridae sp.]
MKHRLNNFYKLLQSPFFSPRRDIITFFLSLVKPPLYLIIT